jgi:3alpha(or 20beta)-hydroxysteroid dehydrogenase
VDIDVPGMEETKRLIAADGGQASLFRADVSDEKQVTAYVSDAESRFGPVEIFFNNAGMLGAVAPMAETRADDFDKVIAVNLRGVFLGLRHVLPVMIARQRGSIINTASMAARGGIPGVCAYVASKHAVIGLTKTAAIEVATSGVRVNAVLPGNIRTKMGAPNYGESLVTATVPQGRMGEADEIAEAVCFLASEAASHVTGIEFPVDGGILAPTYGNQNFRIDKR